MVAQNTRRRERKRRAAGLSVKVVVLVLVLTLIVTGRGAAEVRAARSGKSRGSNRRGQQRGQDSGSAGTVESSEDRRARLKGTPQGKCEAAAKRHRLSESELETLCGDAQVSAPDAPIKCFESLKGRSAILRVHTCTGATSTQPALCVRHRSARSVVGGKTETEELALASLCQRAETTAPVMCAKGAPSKWPLASKVQLCRGVTSEPAGHARLHCASQLNDWIGHGKSNRRRGSGGATTRGSHHMAHGNDGTESGEDGTGTDETLLVSTFCAASRHHTEAVECVEACPRAVSLPMRLHVCSGAESVAPAHCLAQGMDLRSQHALAQISRVELTDRDLAIMCRGVGGGGTDSRSSSSPSPSSSSSSPSSSSSRSGKRTLPGPLECARALPQHFLRSMGKNSQDEGDRTLENLVTQLCAGATTVLPATCAAEAPRQLSATTIGNICAGAQSAVPAKCASILRSSLSEDLIQAACRHAHSLTTAHCLMNERRTRSSRRNPVTLQDVQNCAMATAVPTRMQVSAMQIVPKPPSVRSAAAGSDAPGEHPSGADAAAVEKETVQKRRARAKERQRREHEKLLLPGEQFRVQVLVLDQYDEPMPTLTGLEVSASVDPSASQQGVLGGVRRNLTRNGTVHFDYLTLSEPGIFDVHFVIGEIIMGSMAVRVADRPEAELSREAFCRGLVKAWHVCPVPPDGGPPPDGPSSESDNNQADGSDARLMEQSAISTQSRYLGADKLWALLACLDFADVWSVGLSPLWDGAVVANYRLGVERLVTGDGIPSDEDVVRDPLGVLRADPDQFPSLQAQSSSSNSHKSRRASATPPGAPEEPALTAKERSIVRQAFLNQSLQWHPDRWSASHSGLIQQITAVFERISEAYQFLTRRRGSNDTTSSTANEKRTDM